MNNEVEEFLRRAAQRRAQVEAQLRAQAEARAKGQAQPPPPRAEPPKRISAPAQHLSQQQSPVPAEIVEAPTKLGGLGGRVAASVAEHMRHTKEIAAHVELLGDDIESADEEMAAHLKQTFDHQLGSLPTSMDMPTLTAAASPSVAPTIRRATSQAHAIANLLENPQSVRDAIILAEVLNRPTDRW